MSCYKDQTDYRSNYSMDKAQKSDSNRCAPLRLFALWDIWTPRKEDEEKKQAISFLSDSKI
jgi:hypothetical protein